MPNKVKKYMNAATRANKHRPKTFVAYDDDDHAFVAEFTALGSLGFAETIIDPDNPQAPDAYNTEIPYEIIIEFYHWLKENLEE